MNDSFDDFLRGFAANTKCSVARGEKNPLPCQWETVSTLTYCRVHKGIKIK